MYNKLIYVCSPYAGDIGGNTERAKKYSRMVLNAGLVPVTPHLLYPQFLSEETERETGLKCGIELLKKCDEMWVFGDHISSGMQAEIDLAIERDMIVRRIADREPSGEWIAG